MYPDYTDPTLPCITLDRLIGGTRVAGLAPIGVRWSGTVRRSGGRVFVVPDAPCPRGEFAAVGVVLDGQPYRLTCNG